MQDSYTFVCEMPVRETIYPEVCQEFKKLNFLVQLSGTNPLGRCKSDKVIEQQLTKKTGFTGFSTKKGADRRGTWKIYKSSRKSSHIHSLCYCKEFCRFRENRNI